MGSSQVIFSQIIYYPSHTDVTVHKSKLTKEIERKYYSSSNNNSNKMLILPMWPRIYIQTVIIIIQLQQIIFSHKKITKNKMKKLIFLTGLPG